MARSKLREASIQFALIGVVIFGLSAYFGISQKNIGDLEVESFTVSKAGFEKFKTGFRYTGRTAHPSTDYYEFAIYSDTKRFFLRSPNIEELSDKVPYLTKGDPVKLWHSGIFESDRGYAISQIAKDGRISYSITEKHYENKHKNWVMICIAAIFLFFAGTFYVLSIPNES